MFQWSDTLRISGSRKGVNILYLFDQDFDGAEDYDPRKHGSKTANTKGHKNLKPDDKTAADRGRRRRILMCWRGGREQSNSGCGRSFLKLEQQRFEYTGCLLLEPKDESMKVSDLRSPCLCFLLSTQVALAVVTLRNRWKQLADAIDRAADVLTKSIHIR